MTVSTRKLKWAWITIVLIFTGCGLIPRRFPYSLRTPAPIVLAPHASLAEIARVVNTNTAKVQKLQIADASLTGPDIPPLKAMIAVDRPNRLRLTADSILGQELDLGSNDQHYWIWIKRNQQRAVYYGQHDRFYDSAARQILPVSPKWFVDAIGLVELDAADQHDGPYHPREGQLEIRSRIYTPNGELDRVLVLDAQRGWVLQQQLFDPAAGNRLLASAFASEFRYYPESEVSLPGKVQIQLPPANMHFTLQTNNHSINQIYLDPAELWSIPQPDGAQLVDLNALSSPPPNYVRPQRPSAQRPSAQRGLPEAHLDRRVLRRLPLLR